MKRKSNLFKIILISVILMSFVSSLSFAKEEIKLAETTEEYKKWMSLPADKQKSIMRPRPLTTDIREENKTLSNNRINSNLKAGEIPSAYSLKDNIDIQIRNQRATPECWAFATTTMLSTNIQKMGFVDTFINFSPRHMDYATSQNFNTNNANIFGFYRDVNDGGNAFFGLAYLSNGSGPVLEENFPHSNDLSDLNYFDDLDVEKAKYHLHGYEEIPALYKKIVDDAIVYYNGQPENYINDSGTITANPSYQEYTEEEVKTFRDNIKRNIMQYGSLAAITYSNGSAYFNPNSSIRESYYCYEDEHNDVYANHAISIIGWDDNYSKDNFDPDHKPNHDGAYLIANSHGTGSYNEGYLYISYDDFFIERDLYVITETKNESHDFIYQHDPLAWSTIISSSGTKTMWIANVFNKLEEYENRELITEVGIYTVSDVNVELYANSNLIMKSDNKFDLENRVKVSESVNLGPGYHVIKLAEPIKIKGDRFAIEAKITSANESSIEIPMERFYAGTLWSTAVAYSNESFYSGNGGANTWQDITDQYGGSNFCLKAFITKEKAIKSESISFDKKSMEMYVGDSKKINATIYPENADYKKLYWTIAEGDDVVSVDEEGNVTALKEGTAKVKAIDYYGNYDECVVTVTIPPVNVTRVILNKKSINMKANNEPIQLTATIYPSNATNKNVSWSSSDIGVVTVSNTGLVTPVDVGTAKISVITEDGNFKDECNVTITPKVVNATSITLNKPSCEIIIGDTCELVANVVPSDATDAKLTWTSTNVNVATVEKVGDRNAVITAKGVGTTRISVSNESGSVSAICNVTVKPIEVTGVSLNKDSLSLMVGNSEKLVATVNPSNATNKNISWSSSDETVAKVSSDGEVTGVDVGTAKISAVTEDGSFKAECNVTITPKIIGITGVSLNKTNCNLVFGSTDQLRAIVTPFNATNQSVVWTSSNNKVATVSNVGLVTGVGVGSATITVRTVDGNKEAKCEVVVSKNVVEEGFYLIKSAVDSSFTLDIKGNSVENCANVEIYKSNKGNNQIFYLKHVIDNEYLIRNLGSNKYLDVEGGKKSNGSNIIQYTLNNGDNQKWIIKKDNNGYYSFVSKCNGLYLDIANGKMENCNNVLLWSNNNGKNQKFELEKCNIDIISDGYYKIASAKSRKYVLDVEGLSKNNCANIDIWYDNNGSNQIFKVEKDKDGYYIITNKNSNKCLDVYYGNKTPGTNLDQYSYNNGDNQKWIIKSCENGQYNIISVCNGLYIDVANASISNGNNVLLWTRNGALNQKFEFIKSQ